MTKTLKKIIQLLSDGHFHSGETLGKKLNLTRSAVWKLIRFFPEWDLEIESVIGKGYRVPNGIQFLDKDTFIQYLNPEYYKILDLIEIFDSLDSTNRYLMEKAAIHPKKTWACFAEKQTKGKGRNSRQWVSPYAKNIYCSLLWHFTKDASDLSGLSLATALCIIETLHDLGIQENISVKWPNDVLWNRQKLAGTLIELSGESNTLCSTVIGIGINVAMSKSTAQGISQPWTSIQKMIENVPDRNQIAGILLNNLIKMLILFQEKGFHPFFEKWYQYDMTYQQPVTLITSTATLQGIGKGINEKGHFLLKMESGEVRSFSNGEISVRLS